MCSASEATLISSGTSGLSKPNGTAWIDSGAGSYCFSSARANRKTIRFRKVLLPAPGSPMIARQRLIKASSSSIRPPASIARRSASADASALPPANASARGPMVVSGMYSSSMANRDARPLPTCKPRMSIVP